MNSAIDFLLMETEEFYASFLELQTVAKIWNSLICFWTEVTIPTYNANAHAFRWRLDITDFGNTQSYNIGTLGSGSNTAYFRALYLINSIMYSLKRQFKHPLEVR